MGGARTYIRGRVAVMTALKRRRTLLLHSLNMAVMPAVANGRLFQFLCPHSGGSKSIVQQTYTE